VKKSVGMLGTWALTISLFGCQASLNAEANVNASAEASGEAEMSDFDKPMPSATGANEPTLKADSSRVLLGARHDLTLEPGRGTASCQCLAVGLGGARAAGMRWSAGPPVLDDTTQLTIALSSDGEDCKGEPKGSLGASYWGYRISGDDVVVLVEAARGGRPVTSGAVIPRPVGTGQVYVGPTSKKLPYGRALQGSGLCKVGNPGLARSSGFTLLELGENAPAPKKAALGTGETPILTNDVPTN